MTKQKDERDPVVELYRRACGALEKNRDSTAIGYLQKAVRQLEGEGAEPDPNLAMTVLFAWADLFWSLNRPDLALDVFDRLERQAPGDPQISLHRAIAFFHLARFDEAGALLSDLEDRGYPAADLHFFLGCLAERISREATALSHFERAAMLEPDRYAVPVRRDAREIRKMIKKLLGAMAGPLSDALRATRVIVEDLPSDQLLREAQPRLDPLALTMVDVEESTSETPPSVRAIRLFVKNIEKAAPQDDNELEDRLCESLAQELSLALHSDEEALRSLMPKRH